MKRIDDWRKGIHHPHWPFASESPLVEEDPEYDPARGPNHDELHTSAGYAKRLQRRTFARNRNYELYPKRVRLKRSLYSIVIARLKYVGSPSPFRCVMTQIICSSELRPSFSQHRSIPEITLENLSKGNLKGTALFFGQSPALPCSGLVFVGEDILFIWRFMMPVVLHDLIGEAANELLSPLIKLLRFTHRPSDFDKGILHFSLSPSSCHIQS